MMYSDIESVEQRCSVKTMVRNHLFIYLFIVRIYGTSVLTFCIH